MNKAGASDFQMIILLLKILPFTAPVAIELFSKDDIISNFDQENNRYLSYVGFEWGDIDEVDTKDMQSNQKKFIRYTFDRSKVKFVLLSSFYYLLIVHLVSILQFGEMKLMVPSALLGFFLWKSESVIDDWYDIESEYRNPDDYWSYYYCKSKSYRRVPYIDLDFYRLFSPRNFGVITRIISVTLVIFLSFPTEFPKWPVSTAVMIIIAVLWFFSVPS